MNCKHCNGDWTPPANVSLTSCPFCQKPLIEISEVGDKSKPDAILLEVTRRFGVSILGDKRLSSILKDFMPHVERKYQRIFSQAVADGIGVKLLELETEDAAIRTAKIHTLKDGFKNNNGFNNTADYVIDCFLFCLGWADAVEEKDAGINEDAAGLIRTQLEKAMADGCLSSDEIELLFSLGVQLKLTEDAIAAIINEAINQKGFQPTKAIAKTIKNPKDILCACDWSENRKFIYENGDVYEGDWKDGIRHGKGIYTFANGGIYEGDWKEGEKHGKGKRIYADGAVYEGDWKDDKTHGKGKMNYASGNVYEGDYKDGIKHGKGKFTWLDGDVYEGDWKEDKRTGEGKFTWLDGSVYEGDFWDGKRTGTGKGPRFEKWQEDPENHSLPWALLYVGVGLIVGILNAYTHNKGWGAYIGMPLLGLVYGGIAYGIAHGLSYLTKRKPLLDWPKSLLIIFSLAILTIILYLVIPF